MNKFVKNVIGQMNNECTNAEHVQKYRWLMTTSLISLHDLHNILMDDKICDANVLFEYSNDKNNIFIFHSFPRLSTFREASALSNRNFSD